MRNSRRRGGPCFDFGPSSLKILNGDRGLELPLEREADGRLTASCRERVVERVREFLGTRAGQRGLALCALPARGISLRSLELPAIPRDGVRELIALQVEREFPLPPESLAWGYQLCPPSANGTSSNGHTPRARATVAAIRREALDEYAQLFGELSIEVRFRVAALAGSGLCSAPPPSYWLLDVGRSHSELLCVADGRAQGVRSISWGGDDVTRTIADRIGVDRAQAETRKLALIGAGAGDPGEPGARTVRDAVAVSLRELEARLREARALFGGGGSDAAAAPQRVYLSGGGARLAGLREAVLRVVPEVSVETVGTPAEPGHSAATVALAREAEFDSAPLELWAAPAPEAASDRARSSLPWLWLTVAGLLALAALVIPDLVVIARSGPLEAHLAALRTRFDARPQFRAEYEYLDYLDSHQMPVLPLFEDLVALAPAGLVVDRVQLDRRGGLVVEGGVSERAHAHDFVQKLTARGWFGDIRLPQLDPHKGGGFRFRLQAKVGPKPEELPELTLPEPPAPAVAAPPPPVPPTAPAPSAGGEIPAADGGDGAPATPSTGPQKPSEVIVPESTREPESQPAGTREIPDAAKAALEEALEKAMKNREIEGVGGDTNSNILRLGDGEVIIDNGVIIRGGGGDEVSDRR